MQKALCYRDDAEHTTLMQDKRDDVAAGVKSTALLFAEHTKPILATFAASQIALLGVTGELLCPMSVLQPGEAFTIWLTPMSGILDDGM